MTPNLNRIVIHLAGGGVMVFPCSLENQQDTADWLLKCQSGNLTAIFKGPDGLIHAAIRGSEIAGFSFEAGSPENQKMAEMSMKLAELNCQRLEAEIKNLNNMNSGDSWKDGY